MNPPPSTPPDADVFTWRCVGGHWREDGSCSFCGSGRPSVALALIRNGAEVEPTDKNYKLYVDGLTPHRKCYTNHFSEAQAVELVVLVETGKVKFAYPGCFYSGLAFKEYNGAIQAALAKLKAEMKVEPS